MTSVSLHKVLQVHKPERPDPVIVIVHIPNESNTCTRYPFYLLSQPFNMNRDPGLTFVLVASLMQNSHSNLSLRRLNKKKVNVQKLCSWWEPQEKTLWWVCTYGCMHDAVRVKRTKQYTARAAQLVYCQGNTVENI